MPIQGSPLKYFEYLACGIPVLGSGAPQLIRLIRSDNTGIAMDLPSGPAIAQALEQMLADRSAWKKVGENNRTLAEEKYSWRKVAERVMNIVRE